MEADEAAFLNLLVSGGDDRIALDPATGCNMYGYGVKPSPDDLAFSSSTASTASPRGFAAARATYDRLGTDLASDVAYASETHAIRERLSAAFGLKRAAADIVLSASGTDLHLIVGLLLAGYHRQPVTTISLMGNETGSGVWLAASGRHPMPHPASGRTVTKAEPICLDADLHAIAIPVRDEAGNLRADALIRSELARTIETAIRDGQHCVLIATDVSKTGLIAPDLTTVFDLKRRFGTQLTLLVDACQLRVAPETIRAYLSKGCLVAITGSKFVAGPIFSGALLVPADMARDLRSVRLGDGLEDYSASGDWPADWQAARSLPKRPNFGLVLRWQAALAEMEAMLSHHPLKIAWVMLRFAESIEARLKADPRFEPIPTRRLDRSVLRLGPSYDLTPTIFPFLLKCGGAVLDATQMAEIYRDLGAGRSGRRRVRLGQPVAIGTRDGLPAAALRLCLSAPLVTAAAADDTALDRIIADATSALDAAANMAGARTAQVA